MTNHAYSAVKIGDILIFGDYSNFSYMLVIEFIERHDGRSDIKFVCLNSSVLSKHKIYTERFDNLCAQIYRSQNYSKEIFCWRHL